MGVRHYRELFAWKTAVALNSQIVRLVMGSPEARRDLRYRSQILEAGRGVASSIVEEFLDCAEAFRLARLCLTACIRLKNSQR